MVFWTTIVELCIELYKFESCLACTSTGLSDKYVWGKNEGV